MQACDDFLDELLSHEVGGEGRVPDIRYIHAFLIITRSLGLSVEHLDTTYGIIFRLSQNIYGHLELCQLVLSSKY